MWRMEVGDRVLTDAELALFKVGLELLINLINDDLETGEDDAGTGVRVFESLTPEQKLA
jgi:hypothetical protein